ncbi:MAG: glyoxalase/bleomycin resistance/extradiol dioxygenase family protein [Caulobacteraceae bacterium]|nr:glyoxalase/bleomycin resistance/extradiol dioxygenase family protein [Caulobacteraceae bacterium]
MIDHLEFKVSDIKRARRFYDAAFAPLMIAVVMEVTPEQSGQSTPYLGYGKTADSRDIQAGKPSFWLGEGEPLGNRIHVAFVADSREQVEAFYEAALAAGGADNGGPGLRPHYHPNYYAAFALDPDGHNIEAVCHQAAG